MIGVPRDQMEQGGDSRVASRAPNSCSLFFNVGGAPSEPLKVEVVARADGEEILRQ